MSRRDRYDFFLSRRGAVAEIAQEVADTLHGEGYSVLVQDYDIPFTANFVEAMHEAVKNSRDLIVLYTPDYEETPHTRKEFTSFEADRHLSGEDRRIIILRCANTPVRGLFADKVFQDLAGVADAAERRQRIMAAIRGESQAQKPPPRPFYVPHTRNLSFTGRQAELDRLDQVLLSGDRAAITQAGYAALHGLGGVGKTSLATEYAYRYSEFYAGVWWCNASSRASLLSSLAFLAKSKGVVQEAEPDDEKASRLVFNHLATLRTPWLLVYDNADDPQELTGLCPAAGARVLITSRYPDWRNLAEEVQVDVLPPDEAAAFLQDRAGRQDEAGARELAEVLGYLPLALDHAAAYSAELNEVFAVYAARVRKLLDIPRSAVSEYPRSVEATFTLAIRNAMRKAPHAGEYLVVFSYFAPNPIPLILAERIPKKPEWWQQSLRALVQASLVRHETLPGHIPALTIHRVVMAVARKQGASLIGAANGVWGKSVRKILPNPVMRRLLEVQIHRMKTSALVAVFPKDGFTNPAPWPLSDGLLPHLRLCCESAAGEEATADHAYLLDRAGSYLHGRGRLAAAKPLFVRALEIREQVLGPEHPRTARGLSNLGTLLYALGELGAAQLLFERARAIYEKVLPPEHQRLANILDNLGCVLQAQGNLAAAQSYYERALGFCQKVLPPEHPELANILNNLGSLSLAKGDLDAAKRSFERALAIYEKVLPPEHLDVANILNNLGSLTQAQGSLAAAESYYERVLQILQKVLPPEHPNFTHILNNLGGLFQAQGKLTAAVAVHQRAAEIALATLGQEHPHTKAYQNNLAKLLARVAAPREAGATLPAPSDRQTSDFVRPYREHEIDPADPATWTALPRNAPCPCGSGKKYKYCHGQK